MTRAKTAHRIAFVSDAIYPYNKGGKETRLFEITTRLTKRGHDVHIYCMKWWPSPDLVRKENGVTLHAISPNYPLYSGERRSIRQGILFGLACLKLISEPFDTVEVDHMPYFPVFAMKLVCLIRGKPLFATWHEVWGHSYWVQYMGVPGIIAALIERIALLLPDTFVSISEHTSTELREYVSPDKITTIPLGINIGEIRRAPPSATRSDVIFAGRLLKHKNVDVLIRAISLLAKRNKNIRCLIIGNGPEEHALKQLTLDLNLTRQVRFISFCKTKTQLFGFMKRSRILVLPSTREGYGLVISEANAAGIPAITVDDKQNAARYLVQPGSNGLVTENTPVALAKAIKELTEHPLPRKKITGAAHLRDWSEIVDELEKSYGL